MLPVLVFGAMRSHLGDVFAEGADIAGFVHCKDHSGSCVERRLDEGKGESWENQLGVVCKSIPDGR